MLYPNDHSKEYWRVYRAFTCNVRGALVHSSPRPAANSFSCCKTLLKCQLLWLPSSSPGRLLFSFLLPFFSPSIPSSLLLSFPISLRTQNIFQAEYFQGIRTLHCSVTHGSKKQNCAQYSLTKQYYDMPSGLWGPQGPLTGWLSLPWTQPHGTPRASARTLCSSPSVCLPTPGGPSATWTTRQPTPGISLTAQMAQLGLALNRDPPTMRPAQSKLSAALFSYRLRPCSPHQPSLLLSAAGEKPSPSKKGPEWGCMESSERCPAKPTWTTSWAQTPVPIPTAECSELQTSLSLGLVIRNTETAIIALELLKGKMRYCPQGKSTL